MVKSWVGIAGALALTGCSWVDTQPGADEVVVIDRYQAESCERLGSVNAETLNKLLFVERNRDKVARELAMLARNNAAAMGGNALVLAESSDDARQTFIVYRCNG